MLPSESRIKGETIDAEDVLHDIGAPSMYSSDSQAMGRVGQVTTRAWQTADKMKKMSGRLKEEKCENDKLRAKRYLAKLTINPAITHGISDYVGSLQPGKIADIVVWTPQFFGVKPKLIIKGGFISYSLMGGSQRFYSYPRTWSLQTDVWFVRSCEVFDFSNDYFKTCNKKWSGQEIRPK